MGKKSKFKINPNKYINQEIYGAPHIYTFVDASLGLNAYTSTMRGAYGFVHMSHDESGIMFPLAYSIDLTKKDSIDIMEAKAMLLALNDIRNISTRYRIVIVTDSNNVFFKMKDLINSTVAKKVDEMKPLERICAMCSDRFIRLKTEGHNIGIELCKAHVDVKDQFNFLLKSRYFPEDMPYAKDISHGNLTIDYMVNRAACDIDPGRLPSTNVRHIIVNSHLDYNIGE